MSYYKFNPAQVKWLHICTTQQYITVVLGKIQEATSQACDFQTETYFTITDFDFTTLAIGIFDDNHSKRCLARQQNSRKIDNKFISV